MPKRRSLFPLPIEGIIDHPEFIALPVAGRGILFTIVLHYWATECKPLPTGGSELFAIARCHNTTWSHHRETITRIFNYVKPELDDYYEHRKTRREVVRELGDRGRGIQKLRTLARKSAKHGTREDMNPMRETERREHVQTPEERGGRTRVAPTKGG